MAPLDAVTQSERLMQLTTPLGKDVLLVEHCNISESMSGLFSMDLDVVLDLQTRSVSDVKPDQLLGRKVTVALSLGGGDRYFTGLVKRLVQGHRDDRFQYYQMEVVPWTWLLTQTADCRVFQNMSVKDIVRTVLNDMKGGYSDLVAFKESYRQTYTQRDCCIQYRETAFNFVSRLLEQEGIFYYFEHTDKALTMVLADESTALPAVPHNSGKFRFAPEGGYDEREDTVLAMHKTSELRPGKWTLRDHHFELPGKSLEVNEPSRLKGVHNAGLKLFDFPGEHASPFNDTGGRLGMVTPEGTRYARVRMEEDEVDYEVYSGSSAVRAMCPGYQFELTEHSDLSAKYTLLSVHHSISQSPSYVSDHGSGVPYHNSFVAIPAKVSYRPRRTAPKPVVQGPQTAVVTVKSGEESWLDKFGRVRVQFFWDRTGKNDEKSTCWLRVAQPWAGGSWGGHFWPRVGHEVVVEFLEGDPDRPLVTGSVYNPSQMPPYVLPDYYTRSGIKTHSSKDGSSSNYNELRFEDKKGNEQLFLRAERDMDTYVKNEQREKVDKKRSLIVKTDLLEKVEGNKHQQVKGDHKEKIEGNRSLKITGMVKEQVTGNVSLDHAGDHIEKVGGKYSLKVSGDQHEKVDGTLTVEAAQDIHFKAGMNLVLEGGMTVTLKGPGGFVSINPGGVFVSGNMVFINSGGSAGSSTSASPDSPAPPEDPTDPDVADDGSKGGKM